MGTPTKTLVDRFKKTQVVPVVVIDDVVMAVPAAQALLRGGVDIMEITMRTAAGRMPFMQWLQNARRCWLAQGL